MNVITDEHPYQWVGDDLFGRNGMVCQVSCLLATEPQRWRLTWPDGASAEYDDAGDAHAAIKDVLERG